MSKVRALPRRPRSPPAPERSRRLPAQVVALLALVGSAAAFVPAAAPRSVAPAKAVFDEYVGGEGGMPGMAYQFDPMGLSESNPEMVPWFREAELKHGRVWCAARRVLLSRPLALALSPPSRRARGVRLARARALAARSARAPRSPTFERARRPRGGRCPFPPWARPPANP